jgi:hypothetical protein
MAGGTANIARVKSNITAMFPGSVLVDSIAPEEVCGTTLCCVVVH